MLNSQILLSSQINLSVMHSFSASPPAILRSSRSIIRRSRLHGQTRTFRMGLWSSYLDPNFQREIQRRQRVTKHKYVEALNRKLAWDRQPAVHATRLGLKNFMCSAWRGQDRRPGGRWINEEELEALRNAQITRDAALEQDQNSVARLLKTHMDRVDKMVRTKSRLFDSIWGGSTDPQKSASSSKVDNTVTSSSSETTPLSSVYGKDGFKRRFQTSDSSLTEYEIDPITNRKVFKNVTNSTSSKLRKAINVPIDGSGEYQSQFQSFSPPRTTDPVRERLKEYEKEEYKPVYYREPDGKPPVKPDTVQEGLKAYDSKVKYGPVMYNEPDGKPPVQPDSVQEGLKAYDDTANYGPVWAKEPDGKLPESPCSVREGLKDYDSKANYGPVWANEPDGKLPENPCTVQRGLKDYDSLNPYGPVYYKEPDGKEPEKPCPVQEGLEDYDNRVTYGPVMYNEPDGKVPEKPCSVQAGLKEYDDKHPYRPVYSESSRSNKTENRCSVQEGLRDYDDRVTYQPVYYNEPDGKLPEKPCSVQEGLKEYDAKANYGTLQSSKFKARPQHREPRSGPEKIARYLGNDKSQDIDLLRASDVRAASGIIKRSRQETQAEKESQRRQLEDDFYRSQANDTSFTTTDDIEAAKKNRKRIEDLRLEHSILLNHSAHARSKVMAKIADVESGWPELPKAKSLTGNFVKDFPEEFETTWTAKSGVLAPSKTSANLTEQEVENKVQAAERENSDKLESASATASNATQKIQPSLYRNPERKSSEVPQPQAIPDSQAASNAERKKHQDLVRQIRGIYEDTYGTIDTNHRHVSKQDKKKSGVAAEVEVPTVYKILAYDPTMQSINEAETTSIVADSATPLTPAEVLLRLSNPAKFFPHFAPLQLQGYEIVSGSGDVLVFRKVRNGAPPKPADEPSFASQDYKRRAMNPIDGMQPIAPTGNFASPTGFINYDVSDDSEPPFKSNIDVRREEAVFSGRSNWQDGDEKSKKKGGKAKRLLIGAAWVGACSYAVGVVAEFFKTGGIDGLGPKGF